MTNWPMCNNGCCLECDECAAKPGMPELCTDCLRRREECNAKHRPSANSRQVGGSHYQSKIQHWDFVASNDLDYFQGQITKYVARWKLKGGLQDLLKARHFLDKYIEIQELNTPQVEKEEPLKEGSPRKIPIDKGGDMAPCCECGEDYPRADLLAGHVYCLACRKKLCTHDWKIVQTQVGSGQQCLKCGTTQGF